MKPIFCTDVTKDKHSRAIHGEEFIFSSISDDTRRDINVTMQEASKSLKKAELPFLLKGLRFAGLCFALGAALTMFDGGFQITNLLFCIVGIAVYIGLSAYGQKRKKAFYTGAGSDPIVQAMEETTRRVMEELEIPADAATADVICFRYKEKDGKREVVPAMQGALYVNVEVFLYKNETHLFLADMERVYAFPLQGMGTITPVHGPLTLSRWNKKEPLTDYNLTATRQGIPTDVHYILKFTADGEDYGIYFPCYELETVKRLTGQSEGE